MAMDEGDAFDERVDVGGDDNTVDSGTYVVQVKGKSYAVGLLWNNIDDKSTAVAEAREVAARPNIDADLFCIRQGAGQYGLGHKTDGHARGMVSLAGAMADNRGGNWIGLFEVTGGFYLLAVRDDDIMAQTDKVYASEREARSKVDDLVYMAEWDHIYAPAGLNIAEASELSLEANIGKARSPRLQDVDRVSSKSKLIIGGLLIALLIGAGLFYMNYQNEMERQRLEQEALDLANQEDIGPKVVIPPMPWVGKFNAVEYLSSCEVGLRRAIMTVPGWNTVGLACEGPSVKMALQRDGAIDQGGGTINWVRWALDGNGLDDASATPVSEDTVEVTWPIEGVSIIPDKIETPRISDSRRYLQSHFEEMFTVMSFEGAVSTDFVSTLPFRFNTPFEPSTFASILDNIHGMTVERVVFNLSDFNYSVEGSVYEELEPPVGAIDAPAP